MSTPKFYSRKWFWVVEYYHLKSWFFSIGIGQFEMQFNLWPKEK